MLAFLSSLIKKKGEIEANMKGQNRLVSMEKASYLFRVNYCHKEMLPRGELAWASMEDPFIIGLTGPWVGTFFPRISIPLGSHYKTSNPLLGNKTEIKIPCYYG